MTSATDTRPRLRQRLRAARRSIDELTAQRAAVAVCDRVARIPAFRAAKRVAVYLPFDGELDPGPIAVHCREREKRLFLPAIESPAGIARMTFRELTDDTTLVENRFGIREPGPESATIAPRWLDIVITPLVGFTANGERLGMGGGYYDQTFSFLRNRSRWWKPRLIGVAFEQQRVDALDVSHWDVPLWCIATETALHRRVNR